MKVFGALGSALEQFKYFLINFFAPGQSRDPGVSKAEIFVKDFHFVGTFFLLGLDEKFPKFPQI